MRQPGRSKKIIRTDREGKRPLQVMLDEELHRKFKVYCAMRDVLMRDKVIELIKEAMKGGK